MKQIFFLYIIFFALDLQCSEESLLKRVFGYIPKKIAKHLDDHGRGQQALVDIEEFKRTAFETQQSLGRALELSDELKRIDNGVRSNQDTLEKIAIHTKPVNDFLVAIRVASDLYNVFRLAQDTRRFVRWLFPTQADKEAKRLNELRVTNEIELLTSRSLLHACLSQNEKSLSRCKPNLDRYAAVADSASVELVHRFSNP